MAFRIGPWEVPAPSVLAPMAGVTDRPFRILCRRFGAGLAASEMITADRRLWHTTKSRQRMNHEGEPEPRMVQLAGNDPQQLAEAARANVDLGAQIIDINMGCPAKKVFGKACGSALLAAGGPHPGRGGACGGRAGDGEDPPRHRSRECQRPADITHRNRCRCPRHRSAWPDARGFLPGTGNLRGNP